MDWMKGLGHSHGDEASELTDDGLMPGMASQEEITRLEGLEGEDPALLDDYIASDTIAFIEWPQAATPELEPVTAQVELRHAGGDEREIEIS